MFSSTILDVAIGLVFVFFVVSLTASAILEAIAGIITWRSGTLLKGMKDLLNDPTFTGLAAQLYQHALINPRNPGEGTDERSLKKHAPAYIDPKQFANALIDILNTGEPVVKAGAAVPDVPAAVAPAEGARPVGAPATDKPAADAGHPGKMVSGNPASVSNAIDYVVPANTNPQINDLLRGMARRTGNDLDRMRQEIATWFDNAMDRLSGVYKRWTQLWNFLIALGLAILLNISTIHVAMVLWKQPVNMKTIENKNGTNANDPLSAIRQLDALALPIGWTHYKLKPQQANETATAGSGGAVAGASDEHAWDAFRSGWPANWDWPEMVLGWLITALAALFGAPFWFDLLQRIIRLKAAGPSPKEKKTGAAAAA